MDGTSRTLHLLRHAKSGWDDPALRDDQRPLSPRGTQAARAMGRYFAEVGLQVDLVLCSPARRTRDTWSRVRDGVGGHPEVRLESRIYEAGVATLLELVRELDPTAASVLMIGHNPGFSELAAALAGDGEQHELDALREGMPTAALVSLAMPDEWREAGPGVARLERYVRPRDLPPAR